MIHLQYPNVTRILDDETVLIFRKIYESAGCSETIFRFMNITVFIRIIIIE